MIQFQNESYQLFFSNKLPPLLALNYADKLFFQEFRKLCGKRYRILSIIRNGWQEKYLRMDDLSKLKRIFQVKIDDLRWADELLMLYEEISQDLRLYLDVIKLKDYKEYRNKDLLQDLRVVRDKAALVDAMTNMFHLFSSLVGCDFYENLKKYSKDIHLINQNLIFYTQPLKKKKNDIQGRFELSPRDAHFSQLLQTGGFVNDDVSDLLHLRTEKMHGLFLEIARRLKVEVDDLFYVQIEEMAQFLDGVNNIADLIKERRDLTILFYPYETLNIYEGKNAEQFLVDGKYIELKEEMTSELQGQPASLGKARGKVVTALTSEEAMRKMEKGDILVAPYTAVEYLPAMKLAAAIITETGGITSHAAITSRELGIPCIVGVVDAVKNFKDGQIVEVNADSGKIKVILRN